MRIRLSSYTLKRASSCNMHLLVDFAVLVAFIAPFPSLTKAQCGQRAAASRVVNGEEATPHSWPWQISLRYKAYGHICGGSLIKDNYVLTAAHCVNFDPTPASFQVVVGAHNREGFPTSVQETINVVKVTYHKRFNDRRLLHDVAVLKLENPITVSDEVNTVCLPKSKSDRVAAGKNCYITGWGRTIGGGDAADTLQQAILPIADHSTCYNKNKILARVNEAAMLCAGGQGKGGCQGDSGGPLVCEENGKWVLRGAVSWGHSMCSTDYYSVFARVSNYVDWININTP